MERVRATSAGLVACQGGVRRPGFRDKTQIIQRGRVVCPALRKISLHPVADRSAIMAC